MGDDYEAGHSGRSWEGDAFSPDYQRGQRDREAGMYLPSGAASGPGLYGPTRAAADDYVSDLKRNPVRTLAVTLVQLIVVPIVVGLVAAGIAQVTNSGGAGIEHGGTPRDWALIAGGITFALMAIFVASVLLGFAIGYGLVLISLPFSLWRWLLGFGALSAGLGFALATLAGRSDAVVRQQAVEYGLAGLAAGFAIGLVFRILRGAHRRNRRRTSGASGA